MNNGKTDIKVTDRQFEYIVDGYNLCLTDDDGMLMLQCAGPYNKACLLYIGGDDLDHLFGWMSAFANRIHQFDAAAEADMRRQAFENAPRLGVKEVRLQPPVDLDCSNAQQCKTLFQHQCEEYYEAQKNYEMARLNQQQKDAAAFNELIDRFKAATGKSMTELVLDGSSLPDAEIESRKAYASGDLTQGHIDQAVESIERQMMPAGEYLKYDGSEVREGQLERLHSQFPPVYLPTAEDVYEAAAQMEIENPPERFSNPPPVKLIEIDESAGIQDSFGGK